MALVALSMSACNKSAPVSEAWAQSLAKFREEQGTSIAGPDGWLTLVGRFQLEPGVNTVGSGEDVRARLPADRSPAELGRITVDEGLIWVTAEGAKVSVNGAPVATLDLADDSQGKSTLLEAGSLRLHVIKRKGVFFLRVRDREHPARATFGGLSWYEPKPEWRVRGKLEPSAPGTTLNIVNVLNQTEAQASPGHVVFESAGKTHRLAALKAGESELFILFKDETAGKSTYPAGRFVDASVGADGSVELDFNRAHSPPCAFTAFATCPLPPKENHLVLAVEAGEKYSGQH